MIVHLLFCVKKNYKGQPKSCSHDEV